ncbi:MAG: hypothetical protein B7Z14_09685 [Bosea sp. 32-68-6]|nr:MAG: hypothetical protein B7Z14_09685 [Bosea sp. 32-68-6]
MSANRKVKDLEEHAAAQGQMQVDKTLFPFEAAALQPPKLPDVSISVSVDTILGIDAILRNAIFQMGLGDTEGVRRSVQAAIKKLYPAFEETGKALTGKMEENPPGYDVSAKILVVARDRDSLISKLEHYVDVLKSGEATGNLNHANSRSHFKAEYSEDRIQA